MRLSRVSPLLRYATVRRRRKTTCCVFRKTIPLPLTKRILLHLLRGIAFAHSRKVVHTDLKLDNIFFHKITTDADIEKWLKEDPSEMHPPDKSRDGIIVQAAKSQPLKLPSIEEAFHGTYLVGGFGSAQPSGLHPNYTITSVRLRAPEAFLGGKWDIPADIWTYGCLIFELITGHTLFAYRPHEAQKLSEDEGILYQMMVFTGEVFLSELNKYPLASKYFREDCKLKSDPDIFQFLLHVRIGEAKIVSEDEAISAANLINRCLRLKPGDRATAEELLGDPWFEGVD